MLEDRRSRAYELGVEKFLKFAVENARNEKKIPCLAGIVEIRKILVLELFKLIYFIMVLQQAIRTGYGMESLPSQL